MEQYYKLLSEILESGGDKDDRTGTGTRSIFGATIKYNLTKGFPIVTRRHLHFKSIVEELLWFLRGDTNIAYLKNKGVSIWNEWATPEGNLGAIYGAQWRKWQDSEGNVHDQIKNLVAGIRRNPNSRRHIINAWNVPFLPDESISPQENVRNGKMALAPCHVMYQFYVNRGALSSCVFIRSNDMFLGNPYNTASLALLTHMIAHQCDLVVGEITLFIGDAHIYRNHFEQVNLMISRDSTPLPMLVIKRKPDSIFDYQYDDFNLVGYFPYPPIAAPIAV